MRYRVQIFSHATWEDIKHTVAILKNVTAESLGAVIAEYLDGEGVRAVVEDEADWAAVEEVIDE